MLGYRAHFEVTDRETVLDDSLDEFRTWLRGKGYDPDAIGDGVSVEIAPNVEASLISIADSDASQSLRAQVIERKPEGAWTSELIVHIPTDEFEPAAVLLDIHSPAPDDSQPISTGVPRLARGLLGTLAARDSLARLTDQPILIRTGEVDALAAAIRDPNRRGLLFVAGSADSLPLKAWTKYVATLLRQTAGLASAYVLDAGATRALATLLGPTHAVAPGTLRTYLPGVDPNSELDARRHRILSTTRIVNDRSQWIAGILGRKARENALEVELPTRLQNVLEQIAARSDDALLGRISTTKTPTQPTPLAGGGADVTEAHETSTDLPAATAATEAKDEATPGAPAAPEAEPDANATPAPEASPTIISATDESYLAAAAVMHEILGISDPSPEDWAALAALARAGGQAGQRQAEVATRIEDLRAEVGQVGQERRNLARRLEDEQLEHAATYANLTDAASELRRLRKLLLQTEQASAVYVAPVGAAESEPPGSFVELIANMPDLPGIQFTGEESVAVRLDVHDPLGLWANKTWAILQALSDYAEASTSGQCDRDVHGYLLNLPDGCRGYSANKHAATESEDVQKNTKFSEARNFPVPDTVDPNGSVSMMAHFKIAQSGLISPRLHYYDDVRRSGKVYVGYIGPHLPTKRTN